MKDGPIHKVEDLKGKVVADVGAGSAVDIVIKAMLKKHGLESPRDFSVVEAGFPNMESLLGEKKVDLVAAVQPFTLKPSFQAIDPAALQRGRRARRADAIRDLDGA